MFSSLVWYLAKKTPQYSANQRFWLEMHARLMKEVTAQQKANRIKKRKLRALRAARRRLYDRLYLG